jgi:hypothetical protein
MDEKALKKVMALGFTEEEVKLLVRLMNAEWEYVGNDIMSAVGEGKSIPRAEVFEVVVDAHRLYGIRAWGVDPAMQKALVKKFYDLPYEKMKLFTPVAFPFLRYS